MMIKTKYDYELFCDVCNKKQQQNWIRFGDTNKGEKFCYHCDCMRNVTLKIVKEWVDKEKLIEYLDSELNDLHIRLSDKELPDVCQANLSGGIIWLESLKEKLMELMNK